MVRPAYNNFECISQMRRLRNLHHGRRKSYTEISQVLNAERTHPSPAGIIGGWYATSVKNILERADKPKKNPRKRRLGIYGGNSLGVTDAARLFGWCEKTLDLRFDENFKTKQRPQPGRTMRSARITMALMLTGIRRFELCGLRIIDMPITHGKHEIIVHGKRNTVGRVLLTPYAEAFFNWVCGCRRTGYVFLNESKRKYQGQNINAILHGVGRKTNLPKLRPHILRHTYASVLLWNGCNIGFVRDQLRHANIATTDIYANVITDQLSENPPPAVVEFLKAINPLHPENINTI